MSKEEEGGEEEKANRERKGKGGSLSVCSVVPAESMHHGAGVALGIKG